MTLSVRRSGSGLATKRHFNVQAKHNSVHAPRPMQSNAQQTTDSIVPAQIGALRTDIEACVSHLAQHTIDSIKFKSEFLTAQKYLAQQNSDLIESTSLMHLNATQTNLQTSINQCIQHNNESIDKYMSVISMQLDAVQTNFQASIDQCTQHTNDLVENCMSAQIGALRTEFKTFINEKHTTNSIEFASKLAADKTYFAQQTIAIDELFNTRLNDTNRQVSLLNQGLENVVSILHPTIKIITSSCVLGFPLVQGDTCFAVAGGLNNLVIELDTLPTGIKLVIFTSDDQHCNFQIVTNASRPFFGFLGAIGSNPINENNNVSDFLKITPILGILTEIKCAKMSQISILSIPNGWLIQNSVGVYTKL